MTPIIANTGVKFSGLSMLKMTLSLCRLVKDNSHEVTDVPRFAPMITPTACPSVMTPELTKPTTITVVAEDD